MKKVKNTASYLYLGLFIPLCTNSRSHCAFI